MRHQSRWPDRRPELLTLSWEIMMRGVSDDDDDE
jgi:hypothetical protein